MVTFRKPKSVKMADLRSYPASSDLCTLKVKLPISFILNFGHVTCHVITIKCSGTIRRQDLLLEKFHFVLGLLARGIANQYVLRMPYLCRRP